MVAALGPALRRFLLIWSAITFLPAWLVTIRGLFDGDAYAWGVTDRIKGRGTSGSYLAAPLAAAFGLTLAAAGGRGAGRPFHLMLAAWHGPLAIAASVAAFRNREALRLQGDTLGIDVSLAGVAPAILGIVAAGPALLAGIEQRTGRAPQRRTPDRRLIGVAIAVVPAQFLLLRTGEQNGLTDKLGVLLTIAQWGLINLGLARGREA